MKVVPLAVAVAIVLAACGGSGDGVDQGALPALPTGELPPDDFDTLAAVFDPRLEPLGMRLTRGGLADGPGAGYDESIRGRHLALYVEPQSTEHGPDAYLSTLVTTAQVFLPVVFEQWPALASMDVCQEPPPGVDDRREPPPVTTVEVTREQAAQVDWAGLALPALVAAAERGQVALFVAEDVRELARSTES